MSTREEYSVKAIKSFHGHDGYGVAIYKGAGA